MRKRKSEAIVKEILPPIVLKIIMFFRTTRLRKYNKDSLEGCEQGPKWYDESFLAHEHFRKHYTKSNYYPLWIVIVDRIMRVEVNSLLDIGCGPGQLALLLRDKGLSSYLGFDFSTKRIEWARRVCPEFSFVVANAFTTNLFHVYDYDTVICTEFLEHVERDLEVIEKIRKGTRFFGTVPNFSYKSHVRHFMNTKKVYERYSEHFRTFKVDAFLLDTKGTTYYLMEGIKY